MKYSINKIYNFLYNGTIPDGRGDGIRNLLVCNNPNFAKYLAHLIESNIITGVSGEIPIVYNMNLQELADQQGISGTLLPGFIPDTTTNSAQPVMQANCWPPINFVQVNTQEGTAMYGSDAIAIEPYDSNTMYKIDGCGLLHAADNDVFVYVDVKYNIELALNAIESTFSSWLTDALEQKELTDAYYFADTQEDKLRTLVLLLVLLYMD